VSKFASFVLVTLIFLLMSVVVSFGFFVFTPKIKAQRQLNIALEQQQEKLNAAEKRFDDKYRELQHLQEQEKSIDIALQKRFDERRFERFIAKHFKRYTLRSITTEKEADYETDVVEITAVTVSPLSFYRFVDQLNQFDWAAEVISTQQFRSVKEGLETHFILKVYTQKH